MATQYGPFIGVVAENISYASKLIAESSNTKDNESHGELGSALNQWQKPITEFGNNCFPDWVVNLKTLPYIGEIDFGRKEWARSREAVDAVMDLLLKELRFKALTDYEHLRIDSYIRQGSSRDGLKVIKPDEFDTILEFHIEGLQFLEQPIYKNKKYVPGFCYLKVDASGKVIPDRYPKLWHEKVFEEKNGTIYLSSRMIHQGVFESLIDKSCRAIEEKIEAMQRCKKVNFHITRKMNPPAVNITIHLDDDANDLFMRQCQIRNRTDVVREIDLDIVPALRLRVDSQTIYNGSPVNAVIHAVCKWKEEDAAKSLEIADQGLVWHINSAGYERYILDVARTDQKQKYILTALRILKTYFTKAKTIAKNENMSPPPITTVLKSYHLKQIALYMILYTCHLYPDMRINDVERALLLFLNILHISLEDKHLPHFFYSNSKIGHMFLNYPTHNDALRFDLYRKIPNESLNQAELSYKKHLPAALGFYLAYGDEDIGKLRSEISSEIGKGIFF
ncbi:uncharacterized protein LOC132741780 isoform X1 [Ruditapes philippinarum]|uniref:uncharacterized protein LOC132741780 isoform X1 n=1 Tax=Ruditapes philippinarum TaxID=129788 RepID=UPI00295B99D2|nr:uncharacterized protein LOC132741780 isoform X1 [Ruditapes philippinarum]